ncbi:hypothetical protein [Nocardioides perillae]|uniref:LVIVD repeat-containing protein n=1 Tax=Nocardioides perillae TaxID=1119534 RepID=A0A7Y9RU75_9ACTN|nr:hypothetical protein [Nocardioides perillae]NYG56410.1 hypothetical protein [Nocardioides perillae]
MTLARTRRTPRAAGRAAVLALGLALGLATAPLAPASAHGGDLERLQEVRAALAAEPDGPLLSSDNVAQLSANPSQLGISGCFLPTAPLLVTSGLDSVRVLDVRDGARPRLVGVLPSLQFENEAMNCGERRTARGVRRFALIGVDLYQASPDDIQHANVGGGELVVVDVTEPAAPRVLSRVAGSTSTHTVACVEVRDCRYVYSAGGDGEFSIFDLRDLTRPRELDGDPRRAGLQPFRSPTAGHKWNFDAAGIGTHTGFGGSSMWSTKDPRRPRLLATTGAAGRGEDPRAEGYNDFIHHNSFRPNARRFKAFRPPSLANGNVLLVTEEDYEQTDCSLAGSFQTWWVKRLDGRPGGIVPLDKVELADLGNFPLPQGAFCSAHWFDFRPGGLVAIGYYGGGTQLLDVRRPRDITPYGHALQAASEVWDAMWLPVYDARGRQTGRKSNVVYAIDLVRGLDVYAVDVPGDGRGAEPDPAVVPRRAGATDAAGAVVPVGLVTLGALGALALVRRRSRAAQRAD